MKSLIRFLICAVAGIMLISAFTLCSRKKDCPAYSNTDFGKWFPYSPDQVLVFKNTAGAADTFDLTTVRPSPAYTFRTYNNSDCSADMTIGSAQRSGNRPEFYLHHNIEEKFSLEMDLLTTGFYGAITAAGVEFQQGYRWSDTLLLNSHRIPGRYFDTLQVLVNNDTSSYKGAVQRMYIAPHKGLVAYELFSGNETWVLQ